MKYSYLNLGKNIEKGDKQMMWHLPEGMNFKEKSNLKYLENYENFFKAYLDGIVLEARAGYCDKEHNLHIDFGFIQGIINIRHYVKTKST